MAGIMTRKMRTWTPAVAVAVACKQCALLRLAHADSCCCSWPYVMLFVLVRMWMRMRMSVMNVVREPPSGRRNDDGRGG